MTNCEGCPIVASCMADIANLEQLQADAASKLSGTAELVADIQDAHSVKALLDMATDTPEAVLSRSEAGKERMVAFLAKYPKLSQTYFDHVDACSVLIEHNEGHIDKLTAGCKGPSERKKFIFFGKSALHCNSPYSLKNYLAKRKLA